LSGTSVQTAGWTSHVPTTTDSAGNWNMVNTTPTNNSLRQLKILKENLYIYTYKYEKAAVSVSAFPL